MLFSCLKIKVETDFGRLYLSLKLLAGLFVPLLAMRRVSPRRFCRSVRSPLLPSRTEFVCVEIPDGRHND